MYRYTAKTIYLKSLPVFYLTLLFILTAKIFITSIIILKHCIIFILNFSISLLNGIYLN